MRGQYGVTDIALSLPTIIGRRGVEAVLGLPMSDGEADAFRRSAQLLKERLGALG